jgi:hypothetical protein
MEGLKIFWDGINDGTAQLLGAAGLHLGPVLNGIMSVIVTIVFTILFIVLAITVVTLIDKMAAHTRDFSHELAAHS